MYNVHIAFSWNLNRFMNDIYFLADASESCNALFYYSELAHMHTWHQGYLVNLNLDLNFINSIVTFSFISTSAMAMLAEVNCNIILYYSVINSNSETEHYYTT